MKSGHCTQSTSCKHMQVKFTQNFRHSKISPAPSKLYADKRLRSPDVNSIVGFFFLIPYLLGIPTEIFIDKMKCLDLCQDNGEVK